MKTNWLHLTGLGLILNLGCALAAPIDNWHWRNPLPNGNPQSAPIFNSIVFATGEFVAVGDSGEVSISTDSTNWTESATATANDLNGVVYANGEFVAVGNGGVVETSSDGTNWVLQNSGTSSSLSAVAYGNGKFVALGANAVIASANAVAWTPAVSGLSGAAEVAGGTNGFVAVAYNQVNQVFFSSDGLNWTGQPLAQYVNAVTYANGVYLVGGGIMNLAMGPLRKHIFSGPRMAAIGTPLRQRSSTRLISWWLHIIVFWLGATMCWLH
jgi:hypothetical protein